MRCVELVECDLLDESATRKRIAACRPTACIHAAWRLRPESYRHDPLNDVWVNASTLLHAALRDHGCAWLGVFGTCLELGTGGCRYAQAKARLERYLASRSDTTMPVCWWRLFQPYGPAEPRTRLIPSLLQALSERRPFEVNAPADVRDFIHVEDVANAALASLRSRITGTFDLGTGIGHQVIDVTGLAAELLGVPHLVRSPTVNGAGPVSVLVANPRPLREATGWSAQIDVRTGLEELLAPRGFRAQVPA